MLLGWISVGCITLQTQSKLVNSCMDAILRLFTAKQLDMGSRSPAVALRK